MRKLDSFNRRYQPWLVIVIAATMAQSARGAAPPNRSAEAMELLGFVPESTVSVFCVDSPFKLRRWCDLEQTSAFESAISFTTMLVQHETQLGLKDQRVLCALSAIRNIRDPKRNPAKPIVDGPFQSQRCELFLVPEKLPSDWFAVVAKRFNAKILEIAGRKVLEVPMADEKFLVVQVTSNTICVANHSGYLSEVLQLADVKSKQRPAPIGKNPVFQTALSCISPSAKFWGIRLFGSEADAKDPTSVRNVTSSLSIHDAQAVFAALEIARVESLNVQFHYASEDAVATARLFPDYLKQAVKVARSRAPFTVPSDGRNAQYVVSSTMADLTKWKIAGMAEPGVLFLVFCSMFGQAMQL